MEFNAYGIQHLWKLDGNEDDTVGDVDGTNVGTMTYTAGKLGRALDCDLTATDRIDVGAIDVNNNQAMSLSAWVRIESTPTIVAPMRVISKSTSGALIDSVWQLSMVEIAGNIRARCRINGVVSNEGVTNLSLNTWYFLVMTYDKVNVDLLVNGSSEGPVAYTANINIDSAVDVAIGNTPSAATDDLPLDGQIDQVIIWNKALTTSDITKLYNSGNGIYDPEQQFPSSNFLTQRIVTDLNATTLEINGNNSKAVSVWVYPFLVPNPSEGAVFHVGTPGVDGGTFALRQLGGPNEWRLQLHGDGYNLDFDAGASNTWMHFVISNNGASTRVWVDGVQVAIRSIALVTGDGQNFQISQYDNSQPFFGRIADLRVYSRNIPIDEVQTIYNSRGHDNITNALQARWLVAKRRVPTYAGTRSPTLLGSWQSGTTHTATAGNNRLLVVCIAAEDLGPASTITSVTYGGQTMTELGYITVPSGRVQTSAMYYLNEVGITAASGSTITVTWSFPPTYGTLLTHAMFASIFQDKPVTNGVKAKIESATSFAYSGYYNYYNNLIIATSSFGNPGAISVTAGTHLTGIQASNADFTTFTSYVVPAPNQSDIVTHTTVAGAMRWAGIVGVFDNIANYPIIDIGPNGYNQVSTYRPRHQITELRV